MMVFRERNSKANSKACLVNILFKPFISKLLADINIHSSILKQNYKLLIKVAIRQYDTNAGDSMKFTRCSP